MNEELLRGLVRLIIESEKDKDQKKVPDNLLLEPKGSDPSQESADEASVAGAVAGAITPLGAGPTYPAPDRRSPKRARRETARAVGRAFGGASPKK